MAINKKGIRRAGIGIILGFPLLYIIIKSNIPNQTYSTTDYLIRFCVPLIVALAYLFETWKTSDSNAKNIMKCVLVIVAALCWGFLDGPWGEANTNSLIKIILFGIFLFSISSLFFIFGSYKYRKVIHQDRILKLAYYFSIICLLYSLLQVFIWVFVAGIFQTAKFSELGAYAFAFCVLLATFGPATPTIVIFMRHTSRFLESRKIKR